MLGLRGMGLRFCLKKQERRSGASSRKTLNEPGVGYLCDEGVEGDRDIGWISDLCLPSRSGNDRRGN